MTSLGDRIVVLIDMDCFFCQVEVKLQPELKGKPLAVVQYSQWELGGIIAVNYEARDYGVSRHMRADEAKEKCSDLVLASVPALRGKSDTSRYRNAGRDVIDVLKKHCDIVERASVDEAYLDITHIVDQQMTARHISPTELIRRLSNTFVIGYSEVENNDEEQRSNGMNSWIAASFEESEDIQSQRLAVAGTIVENMRADILEKTGFECSAGISYNKILAKLACGLHKPNRQTILPAAAVPLLFSTLPVKKVRNLGGKFGNVVVESLGCNVMADLLRYSLQDLQKRFDTKTGSWLYNIARGVDSEPVTTRLVSKSIGVCKKFPGKQAISNLHVLKHWVGELVAEVCERLEQDLEENQRRATLLTVSYHYYQNKSTISQSRSCPLNSYKPSRITDQCVDIITKSTQCSIAYLGISASKFIVAKGSGSFVNFFKASNQANSCKKYNSQIFDTLDTPVLLSDPGINGIDLKSKNSELLGDNVEILSNFEKCNELVSTNFSTTKSIETENESLNTVREINSCVPYNKENNTQSEFEKCTTSIQSCNDAEIKISHTTLNNRSNDFGLLSHNNVRNALNCGNFKESFFMNIFNDKNISKRNLTTNQKQILNHTKVSYSENELNMPSTSKTPYVNSINVQQLNDCLSKSSPMNIENVNKIAGDCNDESESRDDDLQKLTAKRITLTTSENYACSNSLCSIENTVLQKESNDLSSTESSKAVSNQTNLIQLQEIFPDLSDIDPSIVSLLPIALQREANLLLKAQKTNTIKGTPNLTKVSKLKPSKCKSNNSKFTKSDNSIFVFLKKGNFNKTDKPSEKCTRCNQFIPVDKYFEHTDFHVAQDLQKVIDESLDENAVTITRKESVVNVDAKRIKRELTSDFLKCDKKCKSIKSFFSEL